MTRHRIIIGLASNLPHGEQTVAVAANALRNIFLGIRVSKTEITVPLEGHGANYANAIAVAMTSLSPEAIMIAMKALEANAGRQKLNRDDIPLDLDLLDYDGQELPELKLPRRAMLSLDFNRRALAELQ